MHISFTPSGDRSQASARLRVHMLADVLRERGHRVETEGSPLADVVVFQKKRNFQALFDAKRAGARVVYDFDDHYLLEDSGARDEVLKMLNFVDVVTVGSPELLAACRGYHHNVHLFENPLDVLPRSTPKHEYVWASRLGWFGNRAGLVALDALRLDTRVTTITAHGDIEWKLDTIDGHLTRFDLVLLPVEPSAWTLAKNANRLFKCVALGVPFLASATPEHRRAVEDLGLPEWLLVADRSDWNHAIQTIATRYAELPAIMRAAALRAKEAYGTERQADRWLEMITGAKVPGISLPESAKEIAARLDVVVLAERTPSRAVASLESVRRVGAPVRSISVVAAVPVAHPDAHDVEVPSDFFNIYPMLARRLGSECGGDYALVVQAGVELRPAALESLARAVAPDSVVLLRPQHGIAESAPDPITPGMLTPEPPRTVPQLLVEPFIPWALVVPAGLARELPIDPRAGALWAWDLLIGAVARGTRLVVVDSPVTVVAPETYAASPLEGHREHLARIDPAAAEDLPRMSTEWKRLRVVLGGYVAERHRELFARWASVLAVAPRPSVEQKLEAQAVELNQLKKSAAKEAAKAAAKAEARDAAKAARVKSASPPVIEAPAKVVAAAASGDGDALAQLAERGAELVAELEATATVRVARAAGARLGLPGNGPFITAIERLHALVGEARKAARKRTQGG